MLSPCHNRPSWKAGQQFGTQRYRCPVCHVKFSAEKPKEKYQGQKAGPIIYPQYRYGSTRLG